MHSHGFILILLVQILHHRFFLHSPPLHVYIFFFRHETYWFPKIGMYLLICYILHITHCSFRIIDTKYHITTNMLSSVCDNSVTLFFLSFVSLRQYSQHAVFKSYSNLFFPLCVFSVCCIVKFICFCLHSFLGFERSLVCHNMHMSQKSKVY